MSLTQKDRFVPTSTCSAFWTRTRGILEIPSRRSAMLTGSAIGTSVSARVRLISSAPPGIELAASEPSATEGVERAAGEVQSLPRRGTRRLAAPKERPPNNTSEPRQQNRIASAPPRTSHGDLERLGCMPDASAGWGSCPGAPTPHCAPASDSRDLPRGIER